MTNDNVKDRTHNVVIIISIMLREEQISFAFFCKPTISFFIHQPNFILRFNAVITYIRLFSATYGNNCFDINAFLVLNF